MTTQIAFTATGHGLHVPDRNATTCPWFWRLPSVTRPGKVPDLHKPCVHRLGFILLGTEGRGFGTLFSAIYEKITH